MIYLLYNMIDIHMHLSEFQFHLNELSSADLFVPCGGRPDAVTVENVDQLFRALPGGDRQPRFKYVVEGANLFFTQSARRVLEKAGA